MINKFTILVIINIPLILVGIFGSIASYKTKKISKKRCITQIFIWILIFSCLLVVEPLYNQLIRHNLTDSQPMSLFDMVLLTGLIFCLLLLKQSNERVDLINKKFTHLHENLAISDARTPEKINE